jgi:putative NIF3 family GTP cyclohydrolase 1 type 2
MKKKTVSRNTLAEYLENFLRSTYFKDYCPNGLQVQEEIEKI